MISRTGNNVRDTGYGIRDKKNSLFSLTKLVTLNPNPELAFTLVELMISVVILGFGLCVIIQSYASALSGFNSSQNYITAMRFAKEKQTELEMSAYENKGLLPDSKIGELAQGNRKFNYKTEISEISQPEYLNKDFVMATVSLEWQERNIPKNAVLITYLPKHNETKKDK